MHPEMQCEFEAAYGPEGEWGRLFQKDAAFVRTALVRDPNKPGRYLTLDFWTSREAYENFASKTKPSTRGLMQSARI